MKSLMDPNFKYIKAENTNLKATFRRIRKEQKEAMPAVFTSKRKEKKDDQTTISNTRFTD